MRRFSRIPETLLVFVLLALTSCRPPRKSGSGCPPRPPRRTPASSRCSSLPSRRSSAARSTSSPSGPGKPSARGGGRRGRRVRPRASFEDKFMANGFGVNRRDVMYNDFVLLGPRTTRPGSVRRTARRTPSGRSPRRGVRSSRGETNRGPTRRRRRSGRPPASPPGALGTSRRARNGEVIMMAAQNGGIPLRPRDVHRLPEEVRPRRSGRETGTCGTPYGIIAVNPKKHTHVKYDLAMSRHRFRHGAGKGSPHRGLQGRRRAALFRPRKGAKH